MNRTANASFFANHMWCPQLTGDILLKESFLDPLLYFELDKRFLNPWWFGNLPVNCRSPDDRLSFFISPCLCYFCFGFDILMTIRQTFSQQILNSLHHPKKFSKCDWIYYPSLIAYTLRSLDTTTQIWFLFLAVLLRLRSYTLTHTYSHRNGIRKLMNTNTVRLFKAIYFIGSWGRLWHLRVPVLMLNPKASSHHKCTLLRLEWFLYAKLPSQSLSTDTVLSLAEHFASFPDESWYPMFGLAEILSHCGFW